MPNQIKILIGDDSLELGVNWAAAFKEKGIYAVTRPRKGRAILEYATKEKPDAIIMDAKMSELDAATLIQAIRSDQEYEPVILVTANYDSPTVEYEVMDAGADYYMVRPFDSRTLAAKVLALLDSQEEDKYKCDPDN
ncbi:MAG: response regulator transcription factor, partial [Ruminiclostridium sp.]|nr:response regulator transcription factor [Ruminiclostridium sp.]